MTGTLLRPRRIRLADNLSDTASPAQIENAIPSSLTQEDYQTYYLARLREVIFGNNPSHHWYDDFESLGIPALADVLSEFLLDNDPSSVSNTLALTRSGGVVTQMIWTNNATSKAIKSVTFSRSGGLVNTIVTQVFSPLDGTTITAQKTDTIVRAGGVTTQIVTTRNV